MPESYYGYEVREPFLKEANYFDQNRNVTGMATEDGKIILNPFSGLSKEQSQAVAKNEAIRLFLRESKLEPDFDVTPAQLESFKGTKYADPENELHLKHSLISRILTNDSSAGEVTEDQQGWADYVLKQLEKRE